LRAGTGPLGRVAKDTRFVAAAREAPSPQRMIYRIRASCIADWTLAMIHTRWMNELELGRLFRTPADLMLDVRKKLEPGLILNPAERMVIENVT
jgi:hypothetical protein